MSGNTDTRQAPADVGQSRNNDWPADPARLREMKNWNEPKTIGIIGSRRRKSKDDYHQLHAAVMEIYNDGDTIVSGGCPQGGDFFAEGIAKRAGATITIHHANWEKYGRSAGFKRNGKIALDADILIALVADDRRGGTEDTIRKYLDLCKGNLIILEGEKSPSPAPAECSHDPTETTGAIGMYHCPECAEMVMAGHAHPTPEPDTTDPDGTYLTLPTIHTDIYTPAQEQEPTPPTVVVNIKQPYDVYIGRRGHGQDGYFGNPHPVGKPCRHCHGITHDRAGAIEAFREDFGKRIETDNEYRQRVLDLAGKRLGCFCAPRPCHGDVIAAWLNQTM